MEMLKHCQVQAGELESEGAAVEYLGRTKVRTKDAVITIPNEKHIKAVSTAAGISARDRSEVGSFQTSEPLRHGASWRGRWQALSLGSRISDLLSLDRREIQYAVKEAARHMSQPRKCDMTPAAYLQSHPHVGRVTTCDPNCSSEWPCKFYSDSDWPDAWKHGEAPTVT